MGEHMENKNIINIVTSLTGRLAEQNTSLIERYHNRIKISRFIGINLFFILAITMITGYNYLIYEYTERYHLVYNSAPIFAVLLLIIVTHKNESKLLEKIRMYLCLVAMQIMIGYLTIEGIIGSVKKGLESDIIFTLLISFLMSSLFLYSIYHTSKSLAEVVLHSYTSQKYKIIFSLVTGEEIKGTLITITKKNDYIVKAEGKEGEILIKNSVISVIQLYANED